MALLLLNNGCANVNIKDHEICADKGTLGAKCYHTLTPATEAIPKPQWDDRRFGQLCEDAGAFADWKAALEKLCSQTNNCTYEIQQAIDKLDSILKDHNETLNQSQQ